MKKLTLCLGLSLFTVCSFAQVQVALTGGVHKASVSPFYFSYPDTSTATYRNSSAGIELGFMADIPIKYGFYFQSGVMLSVKGSNWTQTYDTTNLVTNTIHPEDNKNELLSANTKLHVSYIDMPFNLLYKVKIKGKTKFMIGGGPQLSLLYNGYKDFSTIRVSQEKDSAVQYHYTDEKIDDLPIGKQPERYRILHFSANALAGFDFGRVYLTATYTKDLNEFYQEADRKYKHQTVGAAIGIYLGKQPVPSK